ncbi:C1 family peptidase [Clostridium omnivorum]|uniref:Dockerin domain-containing protein n=1 Tax=Clostridium omnivorum TaxID=1604902 RepID=A0ABQ5N3B5_9CLOT|nr:C1 family peptidase [Clostridium sp. E14]GLC29703.1 hypothetical protein bsdE14_11130 [Clostridium sp. E14]
MFKKFNCFILSVLVIASLCPSPIKVEAKPLNEQVTNYGIKPSGVKIGRQETKLVKSINLPRRFDLREEAGVSSIKDQNPYGTCWTFATMASIESNTKYTTGKEVDLSEINLAVDRVGVSGLNQGGNYEMSASYFANWKGPVLEKDNPYPSSGQTVTPVNVPAAYHIQNSLLLPSRKDYNDNQYLKEAIIENGAVAIIYQHDSSYLGSDGKSYYYNGPVTSNHGVVIVGWDDDYPKEKFNNTPSGNGAFIVKNSWGTWFGEEGYFYISYYDTSLGSDAIGVFKPLEQKDNYDNRYSYGNFNINYSTYGTPRECFIANKHNAVNTEEIGAVAIYAFSTNVPYDVYIDEDFNEANYPSNDASYLINNKKVKSGTLSYGGFNTIKLDRPIKVDSGKSFLVAIKYKDIFSPSLELNNSEGEANSFNINGTTIYKNTYGANALVTYTYNKSADDITAVTLDRSSLTMGIGDKTTLKAAVTGTTASNKKVLWSTSNPKIAVVDEDGVVTAKGDGQATITAATRNGMVKSTAAVNVNSPLAVVSASNKIEGQGSAVIAFNDIINASLDYSKISLYDKSGNILPITMSIDYKKLILKPSSKYLGVGKIHIPSKALSNGIGKTLNADFDRDVVINNYSDTDLINIGSSTIRKKVADNLGKAENAITAGDLKQITYLDITDDNIDLKDIWMLTSLKSLYLTANISSINVEDLKYMNSLNYLTLDNIKMINLNYLKNNKDIASIEIKNSGLYSLEGAEKLSSLTSLYLQNNNIKDISSISSLKNLQYVDFSNNKLSDITPIMNCTFIQDLSISNNSITNIDSLSGLSNLTYLYANDNRIIDVKPIVNLNNINTLIFNNNEISDITPIKTLSDSKSGTCYLSIDNNYVDPNDIIVTYLRNTKSWDVYCYKKKNTFYEFNNYELSNDELNSKRPITFTFNKAIKSVKSGDVHLGYEYNNAALNYEIRGNKLIIHDEQIRSKSTDYYLAFNFDFIDEDGNEQVINKAKNIYFTRNDYYNEDINKNGSIDITDIAQLAKHYNLAAKGEIQWNFDEDLNHDGIIDIYDLTAVASGM